MTGNSNILDLNKIKPEERKIKLEDKEIICSNIPSKVTLEIIEKEDKLSEDNPESFDIVLDLVMKIIKYQNDDKEITKDWLVENTNFEQLFKLIQFVIEPAKDKVQDRAAQQASERKN